MSIEVTDLEPIGHGVERPEQVVVTSDGRAGGADMRDVYIGSITTPYVLKGRSSVPGMPMIHQR